MSVRIRLARGGAKKRPFHREQNACFPAKKCLPPDSSSEPEPHLLHRGAGRCPKPPPRLKFVLQMQTYKKKKT